MGSGQSLAARGLTPVRASQAYLGYLGVQGILSGRRRVDQGPYLGMQGATWAKVSQNLEFYHVTLGAMWATLVEVGQNSELYRVKLGATWATGAKMGQNLELYRANLSQSGKSA